MPLSARHEPGLEDVAKLERSAALAVLGWSLEMEISVRKADNCFSLFSLRVFCDNTVGTTTLLGKQKAGSALGEQEPGSSPESSLEKREAATGGIWLVLDATPTPADNDLINRQPCQIRPQIGWLRARSWIRETFV